MATRYKSTNKWTPENITKLKDLYGSTENWNELLKEFPFSTKRGIQGTAANIGLRKKRISNSSTEHKQNLFDTWTEESAYILGYLEADGYIRYDKRASQTTFCTSHKDLEFLEKLKSVVGFTGKTLSRKHNIQNKIYETKAFVVSSRDWKIFLQQNLRIGKIPEIPKEYLHHYIRGYFDGDGSIYFDNQTQDYKSSFVFGSKELAEKFREVLLSQGIKISSIHKKTNSDFCWYFQVSYKQTLLLADFMYKNSKLYLERKYKQFKAQQELHKITKER